ncbi:MAG TPA: MMPL family transporter [Baekduia sp.]|nr:MMPL family transporter [Baekduia sp.]
MTRLAGFTHDHARRLLVVALAIFAAGAVFGVPVVGKLSTDDADFLDPQSESVLARDALDARLKPEARRDVIALVPRGVDAGAVEAIFERDPEIATARSIASSDDPLLLSTDRRKSIVVAALSANHRDELDLAERLRAEVPDGVLIGGPEIIGPEIGTKVSEDLARAEMIAFPLLFLLSLWVFRGLIAAVLPPLVGVITIVVTFLCLRLINAQVTGISIFAVNLVTGIGLGLAIDYSLFIVSRFREELARGKQTRDALITTLRTAGRTVLFSAITIAAAMASLLVFPLRFLSSMGIGGVVGAIVGATVSLTVLPAVLALLGPRIDALSPAFLKRAARRESRVDHQGAWHRIASAVMKRPALVAGVTAAVLLLAGLPFLRINFVATDYKVLPVANESRVVIETVERDFPGGAVAPIDVLVTAAAGQASEVAAYAAKLRTIPGVGQVPTPVPIGPGAWLIQVRQRGDPLTEANLAVVRAIRATTTPLKAQIGSQGSAFIDQRATLSGKLLPAALLLCATTFIALFLLTGSLILPIKALIMNFVTISAAFGLLVFVFQDGRLEGLLDYSSAGGIEQTQPVLLFAIAFGLATDYGVFLLSRIKEARDQGMENREAVAFGVERTGRIITAAALLFCVAVGSFATSGVLFVKQVGIGIALAVAIDATIVRALLVPALMALLGRWNWWAPGPLRRLHERFGLHEH